MSTCSHGITLGVHCPDCGGVATRPTNGASSAGVSLAERDEPIRVPSPYELAQLALEPLRALIRWYAREDQVGRHYTQQAVQASLLELEQQRQTPAPDEPCPGQRRSSR